MPNSASINSQTSVLSTTRRAGSKSVQEYQSKAYQRLSEEQRKKQAEIYQAKVSRELNSLKLEQMQKERLSKLSKFQQQKAKKEAHMDDREKNQLLKQKATDDVLDKMDLIKKKLLAQAYGAKPKVFLRKLITKYDLDGNESLDRLEFTQMMRMHLSHDEASTLFAFVDKDDTGSVSSAELADFLALDKVASTASLENLSRRAVPSSPRSRVAFLYTTLASIDESSIVKAAKTPKGDNQALCFCYYSKKFIRP